MTKKPIIYEPTDQFVRIERAVPNDAESILKIKQTAWLKAYPNTEHNITTEDIYKKLSDKEIAKAVAAWKKGIASENDNSSQVTYVARKGNQVFGYTAPRIEDGQRRIGALYVLPDHQGKGIGKMLLMKALAWHGSRNDVYLHVVSYNNNAISFYEMNGFQKTGLHSPQAFDTELKIKLLPETEMILRAKRD